MLDQKKGRNGDFDSSAPALSPAFTAEAMRLAQLQAGGQIAPKSEDRLSLFWRLFGGAVVSVVALIGVTAYQQLNANITELRGLINHINETNADLVRKDEFNSRTTTLWNGIKESITSAASVPALKERSQILEQQLKTADEERKELTRQIQSLRERLVVLESQHKVEKAAKPVTVVGPEEKP
jgi:hypothetical protein